MNNISENSEAVKSADSSTSKVVIEVLGPLTVLAGPVYTPDDEACPLLFATLPNGLAVVIEDWEYFDYADHPISIFRHLRSGDVIVFERAIRADSWGETATTQKSWSGRYYPGGAVHQLTNGKMIDLDLELMAELLEDSPDAEPEPTVVVH